MYYVVTLPSALHDLQQAGQWTIGEPFQANPRSSFCADRRKNFVRGPFHSSEPLHVTAALLSLLIEWFHRESIPRLRLLITASSSTSQRHAPSSFAPLSNATANTRPSSPHVTPCLSLCDKWTTLFHHRSPPELHLTLEIDTRVPIISLLPCWSDHHQFLLAAMNSNPNGSTSSPSRILHDVPLVHTRSGS